MAGMLKVSNMIWVIFSLLALGEPSSVVLSVIMVAAISTATTTAPVEEGEDKPRVMAPTLVCLDCLVATMAVTVDTTQDTTQDTTLDTTQDTTNTLRIPTAIPAAAFSSRGSVSVTTR